MKPETCYWDEARTRLIGTRLQKVREYLREKLIVTSIQDKEGRTTHPEKPGTYYVLPTKNRHQIHTIDLHLRTCTCQHGTLYTNGVEDKPCTHWDAVQIYLERQDGGSIYEP